MGLRKKTRLTLFLITGLMLLGGSAFPGERLVIVSPHWEGIRREFSRAFEDWYKHEKGYDLEVEWLEVGASSNILIYVRSEFSTHPEGIGVDLLWGGGSIYYRSLAEEGLLSAQELSPDILKAVPGEVAGSLIYDPGRRWFGTALSSFGILYNREVLEVLGLAEPVSWRDLSDPVYFDWVVLADPRHSGTSHALFEIMLQAYGFEDGFSVITRSFANARIISKASSQIPVLVATGEAALGPAIDFYAWSKIAEVGGDRLGFTVPSSESVINTDPIAALRGAPHPDVARLFMEFVLSGKGQKLWMLSPGDPEGPEKFLLSRLSVLPGLYDELGDRAVVKLNPFKAKGGFDFDDELAAERWQTLNDLIGTGMIDAHEDLKRAFREIKEQEPARAAMRRLVAPPESEAVFMKRGEGWHDPAYRNRVITSWSDLFGIKYEGVLRMAGDDKTIFKDRAREILRYIIPVLVLLLVIEVTGMELVRRARLLKRGFSRRP
jgi:ABC-type Fe3+ transport system substrate-binding protein